MAPPKKTTKEVDAAPQSGEEDAAEAAAGVKRPATSEGDGGVVKKVATDEKQTFKGGCHCGYIQYEIKLNPSQLNATRCNCTFCQKLSTTNLSVEKPESDFKLLKPASREELADYAPRMKSAHRYFCKDCGTHVFGAGEYEFEGTSHEFFAINLATVDQPQDGIDLSNVRLQYWDALHDNWYAGLADKPWPGGLP